MNEQIECLKKRKEMIKYENKKKSEHKNLKYFKKYQMFIIIYRGWCNVRRAKQFFI